MNFDALARHYRCIEWLFAAGQLQRCRTAQLQGLANPKNVLIYGEGNGRFLAALLERFPKAQITCVDASSGMLTLAKERLRKLNTEASTITFVHADALEWSPPSGQFDLIVTHFFFDCFTEDQLQGLVPLISTAAGANSTWLVGDFQIPKRGIAQLFAKLLLAALYRFFQVTTGLSAERLTDPDRYLRHTGFQLAQRRELVCGLLRSDVWRRGV